MVGGYSRINKIQATLDFSMVGASVAQQYTLDVLLLKIHIDYAS